MPHRASSRAVKTPSVAIIGAGIGGLVLAHALRARGFSPDLYEQSAELTEIGAAVALSANATRELERLDLLDGVRSASTEPTELIHRDGRSGARISSHPVRLGGSYHARFDAPYFGIHRADLQKALSARLGGAIALGHRLVRLAESPSSVRMTFANGVERDVDVVIGADGVRSSVRRFIAGTPGVVYSKTSAFRGIVPAATLRALPDPEALQFWMGPRAHLLHYAIGRTAEAINFFAVVEGPEIWPHGDKWVVNAAPGEATRGFANWHPAVTEMINAGWVDKRWGLFVVQQPRRWSHGEDGADRRRGPRDAAASRPRREHDDRGRRDARGGARTPTATIARRVRCLRTAPQGAHTSDSAQLVGDQHGFAPRRRRGARAAELRAREISRAVRLDPQLRRTAIRKRSSGRC